MPERSTEVLDRFRQGEADAFETIYREHQREVYGWILRIVRNAGTAEELTVETFWRIYRAHAAFDPGRGFEPWARRIATNAALDWLRTRRPERERRFWRWWKSGRTRKWPRRWASQWRR